ncbi:MAG: hypothetical protein EAX96_01445 [Candidatus Lokiarchaeota archaeon]|nr:hypothetical protein [Candidatus Lokiarchaeota archaeon]
MKYLQYGVDASSIIPNLINFIFQYEEDTQKTVLDVLTGFSYNEKRVKLIIEEINGKQLKKLKKEVINLLNKCKKKLKKQK